MGCVIANLNANLNCIKLCSLGPFTKYADGKPYDGVQGARTLPNRLIWMTTIINTSRHYCIIMSHDDLSDAATLHNRKDATVIALVPLEGLGGVNMVRFEDFAFGVSTTIQTT